MGMDPNNGWWPIAWVVVEKKTREQWYWFLELLIIDLEIDNSNHYTFMSDQQMGLASAIAKLLSNSNHRFCMQHMYRNFKKIYPSKALHEMLWSIASSSNIEMPVGLSIRKIIKDRVKISRNTGDPHHYVDLCYNKDLFLQIYDIMLQPVNGPKLWPLFDEVDLDPPIPCVQANRPKKSRRRDPNENKRWYNFKTCKTMTEETEYQKDKKCRFKAKVRMNNVCLKGLQCERETTNQKKIKKENRNVTGDTSNAGAGEADADRTCGAGEEMHDVGGASDAGGVGSKGDDADSTGAEFIVVGGKSIGAGALAVNIGSADGTCSEGSSVGGVASGEEVAIGSKKRKTTQPRKKTETSSST
ncbi:hypothetical protein ACH5RR_018940 [Cinchona calisaya]|uniref:MULE transposase domain-containing protein n=1 Tax=Cinchona calisaya TaxID=153742 RepID=A0ABD2ZMX1_9GENT